MKNNEIRQFLEANVDKKYQQFNHKIVATSSPSIGIRTPIMRQIAKQIALCDDFNDFWATYPCELFEDTMIRGMAIGYLKNRSFEDIKGFLRDFLPNANSWAHIDCVVAGLKITAKYKSEMYDFALSYLGSEREFEVRFAIIVLMCYYIDEDYIDNVLTILSAIKSDHHYVQMGAAWALSVCFVKFRDLSLAVLESKKVDPIIHNMALRKIIESRRVTDADKALMRTLKQI